ncbi:tetratricopeptide repeat-containing sensor histidine kinase [Urechidicola croceus]|uniref:histidine kinase n=1 Tax=Urechidicola croceus TaxID=1850246 RepID=A0A1D8P772_9FLAO|nr:ATP-binding protein [Urechidicola croceus]AOW20406.1 hypothetical protein LPB138_06840 [Urechidicola croceus]
MEKMRKIAILSLFILSNHLGYTQDFSIDSLIEEIQKSIKNKDYDTAQKKIIKAQDIQVKDSVLKRVKINYYQSKIYLEKENYEKSLNLLLSEFSELQDYENSKYYSKYSQDISNIFSINKNYAKALEYSKLALKNAYFRKDSLDISISNFTLGSIYQTKQVIDSAKYYYNKTISFHPKTILDKELLATTYSNLIGVSLLNNEFEKAESYGLKALELLKNKNDVLKIAGVLSNLGSINMYSNNLIKANKYYFEAYDLLKDKKELKAKEIKAITLDNISQVFYMQGKHQEAYDYLFESTTIEKELITENLESKVNTIEAKYNSLEKDKLAETEAVKREKAEMWLYVSGIVSCILLGFLWLMYRDHRLKKKNLKLEYQQQKLLQQRKIEQLQNESQIKILNATIDAKESERKHIAEILHDSVSTLLSSASMHLQAAQTELKEKAPKEISKSQVIINEATDKIRDLSHKLISSVLLRFGVNSAVEDLCEKYSNSELNFSSESKNIGRYQQSFEIKVHNIIEELINNILKHSNANNATIKLEQSNGKLQIIIFDDGEGFDINEITQKDGLGLSQIDARIKMMKGIFDIKSSNKTGTRIYINIPIPD